jgi:hypothetical protein
LICHLYLFIWGFDHALCVRDSKKPGDLDLLPADFHRNFRLEQVG